jgi:hypothetical protein
MALPPTARFDSHFGFLKGGEDHLTQCLGDKGFPSGHGPAAMGGIEPWTHRPLYLFSDSL